MRVFLKVIVTGIIVVSVNFLFVALYAQGESDNKTPNPALQEKYFGQTPPGEKAEAFAPDVLIYEAHDSPVIPPDEKWLLFQGMEVDVLFYGLVDGRLTAIDNPLGIDFPDTCNGVAMSPSGDRLYIEEWKNGQAYLYYIEKQQGKWSLPTHVDLSEVKNWWQISIASSGSLYLASDKVIVSPLVDNAHIKPEALKLEDDSDMMGSTPFISPDESYIIYSVAGNLCISYRRGDGKWTMPQDLGPDINSGQSDICPQITPNGKYLLFNTRRDSPLFRIYWARADFIEDLRPKE